MNELTIEAAKTQMALADQLIQDMTAQSKSTAINIPTAKIELQPGEHYAGAVLNEDENVWYHVVLMADKPSGPMNWNKAIEWAHSVGGALPDRQEHHLLLANCRPCLEPVCYWSSQEHNGLASHAWYCYVANGIQLTHHKSSEQSAVAVRYVF